MAYGVTTRMYLAAEPARPAQAVSHAAALWRQLEPKARLEAVERTLRTAA
ncbi:hypothetical protein [Sphingomonas astaxanthinifaciens]|uniref:Uncharacterized protein n=1 Tax=Sphingomonas astaxanthinifaciens DSM 22298 TaxID=1123267 RepID=A0ABQ5Z4P0_9SPHN|nr:hypothetical protein [Sphingomonas astaxanthinifaciens]GLR46924.1 hypothetical protein GCM10007925_06350 [Sphingomonas astaxanthinifaciens DSM 22298]